MKRFYDGAIGFCDKLYKISRKFGILRKDFAPEEIGYELNEQMDELSKKLKMPIGQLGAILRKSKHSLMLWRR